MPRPLRWTEGVGLLEGWGSREWNTRGLGKEKIAKKRGINDREGEWEKMGQERKEKVKSGGQA